MGTIYDVEDTTVGKHYVLKTLHLALRDREDLATRMAKEARVLAQLAHENIVEVITAGVTADDWRLPFFVMERLRGQSLRQVMEARSAPLPWEASARIAINLLDALEHAHEQGIIHRDVKPENVFLHKARSGKVVVKLLDFGVMRVLKGTTRAPGREFVGTPRYAPPEQLVGEPATAQSDVYAAALVLYEMVSGRGPFDDAPDDTAIIAAHLTCPVPTLPPLQGVPPELDAVVSRALSKNAKDRPKDAFSFAAELRALLRRTERSSGRTTAHTTVEAIVLESSANDADTVRSAPPAVPTSIHEAEPPVPVTPAPRTPPAVSHVTPRGAEARAVSPIGFELTLPEAGASRPRAPAPPPAPSPPPAPAAPRPAKPRRIRTISLVFLAVALTTAASLPVVAFLSMHPPPPAESAATVAPPPAVAESSSPAGVVVVTPIANPPTTVAPSFDASAPPTVAPSFDASPRATAASSPAARFKTGSSRIAAPVASKRRDDGSDILER